MWDIPHHMESQKLASSTLWSNSSGGEDLMQLSEDEGTLLEEMNSVESKGPPSLWVPPFKLPPFTQLRVSG